MFSKKFWTAVAAPAAALALAAPAAAAPAQTPAAAAGAYEWVALGDSYTAGLFTGPRAARPDGCERTEGSYPDLVNSELAEFPPGRLVELTDVSCAGATLPQIANESQKPTGWGAEPDAAKPSAGWASVPAQTTRAKLGESTDVVTIGAGASSLSLHEIIRRCLELGPDNKTGSPCKDHYENPPAGVESLDNRLARVEGEYVQMLAAVHDSAPSAKVVTVGYPTLFPADATACGYGDPTKTSTLAAGDIAWLREAEERLNNTISRVTGFFGDRYVDTYHPTEGHDVCQSADEKWAEGHCGTVAPDNTWPAGRCATLGPGKRHTSFHTNSAGHEAIAPLVERAIRIALLER